MGRLDDLISNFMAGGRRRSRHSNAVFATRKDRRIFDAQFLKPRVKKRRWIAARRAKAIKTFNEQERHDNPGHPTLMYLKGD